MYAGARSRTMKTKPPPLWSRPVRICVTVGCGRGGDIFELDHPYLNLDFKASIKKHEAPAVTTAVKKKEKVSSNQPLTVREQKLLARVVSYYQHAFAEDPAGMTYLKTRGISDNQLFTDFGTGFVNGTLLNILPEDDQVIASLKKIGILNAKGRVRSPTVWCSRCMMTRRPWSTRMAGTLTKTATSNICTCRAKETAW